MARLAGLQILKTLRFVGRAIGAPGEPYRTGIRLSSRRTVYLGGGRYARLASDGGCDARRNGLSSGRADVRLARAAVRVERGGENGPGGWRLPHHRHGAKHRPTRLERA